MSRGYLVSKKNICHNLPLFIFDPKYSEAKASRAMKKKEILIQIILNTGKTEFEVLTSDLSEDYVLINSDYRS